MKVLLFKTNIDIDSPAEHAKVAKALRNQPKIIKWSIEEGEEDEFTVLFIMCGGLNETDIEKLIKPLGFKCEFWGG